MTELIEQRLIYLINSFLVIILISSCGTTNDDSQLGVMLECALNNIIINENSGSNKGSFLVGQHDDWGENKSLIIISYIPHDKIGFIQAEEKSKFKGKEIYFYRSKLNDNEDENTFQKIPNNLKWEIFENENSRKDVQPFFDPETVQLVYNSLEKCWVEIIEGKNLMQKDWRSKCESCKNDQSTIMKILVFGFLSSDPDPVQHSLPPKYLTS